MDGKPVVLNQPESIPSLGDNKVMSFTNSNQESRDIIVNQDGTP